MKRGSSPTPIDITSHKDNKNNEQGDTPSLPSPTGNPEQDVPTHEDMGAEREEVGKEEEAIRELDNIVNAFRWYYYYVMQRMDRSCSAFSSLPQHHRDLVPDFESSIPFFSFFFFIIYLFIYIFLKKR
jgi:hypothetical protein